MRARQRWQVMTRVGTLAVLAVIALPVAGCVGSVGETPQPAPSPSPEQAAADAGGACHLLDFDRLQQRLGVEFEIAGSARKDKTHTCVVRPVEAALPELSLSVTPTSADVSVFKDVVRPDGAKSVSGLGRGAFRVILPEKKGRGPSIEIGWLTGNARLLLLKVTLAKDSDEAAVTEMTAKLTDVAKDIDKTSI